MEHLVKCMIDEEVEAHAKCRVMQQLARDEYFQHVNSCAENDPLKRMKAPPFELAFDSEAGKEVCAEANDMKEKGNTAVKNKHYSIAIELYTDALRLASQVLSNEEQIGALFSNRSLAFSKVSQFEEALLDGKCCIFHRRHWYKGAWRVMTALMGLKNFEIAFGIGLELVTEYLVPTEDRVAIFTDTVLLLSKVPGHSEILDMEVGILIWKKVLRKLVKLKEWSTILILFQGKDKIPPIIAVEHRKPAAADVDLSGLLESCSMANWKSWGQRLAVKLLQNGAKMETLDQREKHAAHSAFKVAIRTGVYDLLKHLFLHYIPSADRDREDDEGDTLLHIACREQYPSKLTAVKLLLEHGLNPLCRNKTQRKPLDLLSVGDPDRTAIIQVMGEKGYELSVLTSEVNQDQNNNDQDMECDTAAGVGPVMMDFSKYKPMTPISPSSYSDIQKWSRAQVQKWLSDNNISDALQSVQGIDGRQLVELRMIQETAPATFYQLLHQTMGLSVVQLLTVASAIRQLF